MTLDAIPRARPLPLATRPADPARRGLPAIRGASLPATIPAARLPAVADHARDTLPTLPPLGQEIAERFGEPFAVAFLRRYGGTRVRFAARPRFNNPLLAWMGERRFHELRRAIFGDARVEVPAARAYLAMLDARALRRRGRTVTDIATALGLSYSCARRYVTGIDAPIL
ncbi:MAG TPA: hypothetical protein VED40_10405 [Azospirillaceae bacterium]|nr:hypothetical protein [Azospirillaceae bacterium]